MAGARRLSTAVGVAVALVIGVRILARADWTMPVNLSNSAAASQSPLVTVDGSANVHVVWEEGDSVARDFYHIWRPLAGAWPSPTNISSSPGDSTNAAFVCRGDALHLAWQEEPAGGIRYASRLASGAWSMPVTVSSGVANSPHLAVDPSGTVHVVWSGYADSNYEIFHAARPSGGAFGTPVNISHNSGASEYPWIEADSLESGAVHVLWQDYTLGNYDILYARRSAGGNWSTPVSMTATTGESRYPRAATAGDGTLHVVWEEYSGGNFEIGHAARLLNGSWITSTNVSDNLWESRQPRLAVDSRGGLHIVWRDDSPGNYDVFYRYRSADGVWSAAVNLSAGVGDSSNPRLAVDTADTVHVVWQDTTPGNLEVMHTWRASDSVWHLATNVSHTGDASTSPQIALDGVRAVHVVWQEEGAGAAEVMYAANVPTGAITGQVRLQGRSSHEAAVVAAGSYTNTTDAGGTFTLSGVVAGTYTVTAQRTGYVPVVRAGLAITDGVVSLPTVTMFGGDADGDGQVALADLVSVGANFGASGGAADINGDGAVNIFDLALVGANFGRRAPLPWGD